MGENKRRFFSQLKPFDSHTSWTSYPDRAANHSARNRCDCEKGPRCSDVSVPGRNPCAELLADSMKGRCGVEDIQSVGRSFQKQSILQETDVAGDRLSRRNALQVDSAATDLL